MQAGKQLAVARPHTFEMRRAAGRELVATCGVLLAVPAKYVGRTVPECMDALSEKT